MFLCDSTCRVFDSRDLLLLAYWMLITYRDIITFSNFSLITWQNQCLLCDIRCGQPPLVVVQLRSQWTGKLHGYEEPTTVISYIQLSTPPPLLLSTPPPSFTVLSHPLLISSFTSLHPLRVPPSSLPFPLLLPSLCFQLLPSFPSLYPPLLHQEIQCMLDGVQILESWPDNIFYADSIRCWYPHGYKHNTVVMRGREDFPTLNYIHIRWHVL